ncbi:MAG: PBP1A family penicillin-binding protein [Candidatus Krumholzibacteria bacterium]|nr:PBP1A family penicillin-binding protein [Candidatus Krumholzibacteria bacterium]MDH4335961.1 PBP1A family penicillin-binding protein [Candidatus Krumholzibacteria bacterium]MDH5268463.1 PBP1A family penicillin-binding protein [Candidatus Krumholzibacteria bacterium]
MNDDLNNGTTQPPRQPPPAAPPADPAAPAPGGQPPRWRVEHILIGVAVLASGLMFSAYRYFARDLPSTSRLEMIEPTLKTQVFGADSSVVGEYFVEDRALVPLEDLPPYLVDAFIAIEDRKFYTHWGVDMFGIARAVVINARRGQRVQGGSTITQQLGRNLFDMFENTLTRKIKEAMLAMRIERAYSKDEILEMYLNQIYFGGGAHGVEAAAQTFFGKKAKELTIGEATMIAGLPKNPRDYSPINHLERAMQRRDVVLAAMVDTGKLTRAEADSISVEPVNVRPGKPGQSEFAAYFLEEVRQYLEERYGSDRIYRDGLKVYTGLDPLLQRAAEDSMESQLARMEKWRNYSETKPSYEAALAAGEAVGTPAYLQGAVVAIDVKSGLVRALVGGRSFKDSKFDRAVQAKRQPGSAFKPFIFAAAMENGYTPADILLDAPIVLDLPNGDVWKPQNYSETFEGEVTLRHALNVSINIAAIRLLMAMGPAEAINMAHRLGIKSDLEAVYSLALGVSEVTLLEMTNAYATLAAGGMRGDALLVKKVVDREGRVLEENSIYREEVVDPAVNYMITSLLESVMNEGFGHNARVNGFNEPAAGKTGTTDLCTDAWFVGFTGDLAVGVWSGFDEKKTMGARMTGSAVSLPTWTSVMKTYYAHRHAPDFPEVQGVEYRIICEKTGLLATEFCPRIRREVFIVGTEPRRSCDRHGSASARPVQDMQSVEELDRRILEEH